MRKRVGRRVSEDEMSREEAKKLWEQAQPVEVERRRAETSILSVRLPRYILRELILEGRRQGKGPATLARELIEEGLARREGTSPVLLAERLARRLKAQALDPVPNVFFDPKHLLVGDRSGGFYSWGTWPWNRPLPVCTTSPKEEIQAH